MVEDYPKVPQEELLHDLHGNKVYLELQQRYASRLQELKAATDLDGVKLVVLIMTPEVGKFATPANTYGIPYIRQICKNLRVEWEDITEAVALWSSEVDAEHAPQYGNWTKQGAAYAASQIAPILAKYGSYHSNKTFAASERPATFGDATTASDGRDNNNDLPAGGQKPKVRFNVNSQGLRMDFGITFPKTRQRIVFVGDSRILDPFVDDEHTITQRLQDRITDAEIVNAGNLSCTMDDYVSLYKEKVRYAEPDVLVVCTNGGDILDEYFTHRNRYSRVKKCYKPTEAERQFYNTMFKAK